MSTLVTKSVQRYTTPDGADHLLRHGQEIDLSRFPADLIPLWIDSGRLVESDRRSLYGLFSCFISGDIVSLRLEAPLDSTLAEYEILP